MAAGTKTQINARDRFTMAQLREHQRPVLRVVYAVAFGDLVKIGYTGNLRYRLYGIRSEVPQGVQLTVGTRPVVLMRLSFPFGIARHVENWFHRQLADKKVAGEWFACTVDDIRPLKIPARHYAKHVQLCIDRGIELDPSGRGAGIVRSRCNTGG